MAGGERLTLAELTRRAGVSVRTVRYYIAEGLLPPPAGAGPRSAYTAAHLDRLSLIARLKATFLPLKEIRRRLDGLDDDAVRRLLEPPPTAGFPAAAGGAENDGGQRLLGTPIVPARPRIESGAFGFSVMAGRVAAPPPAAGEPAAPHPILGRAYPAPALLDEDAKDDAPVASTGDAWRRVSLGDDAELLIRESAYRRRGDRVDWLVRWARKVFG